MSRAPRPADEGRRLVALRSLGLEPAPEDRFDRITRVTARLFGAPVVMINLIDAEQQWSKACFGGPGDPVERDHTACAYTILGAASLIVPDLLADPRFATMPGVAESGIRFYAGHPLRAPTGERIGSLCVLDVAPRVLDADELVILRDLAGWVESELARSPQAETQRSLERSEARLWTILDTVGDAIITFSRAGTVRFANRAAEAMFRAGPGQLADTSVASLLPETSWVGTLNDGTDAQRERRLVTARRRDGETFPLELLLSAAWVGEEEDVLVAVGRDVGDQLRAEAARRQSDRRFRAVFESAGVGMLYVELPAGQAIEVNQSFADLVGYTVDELRGEGFRRVAHPDHRADDARLLQALNAGEIERVEREQRYVRHDGTVMWGRLNLSVVPDDDGRPSYAIGVFEDVTQRREAERLKDDLVSVASHELRTPLTSIRGLLGLLSGGVLGPLSEEAERMIGLSLDHTDRLVRLVNDILDIERLDAGRMALQRTPVSARTLVDQAVEVVRPKADEADVRLRVVADDAELAVDEDRVVRALINLIGNAVKFSPSGAEVTIEAVAEPERVLFSVRDAGRGIPPEQIEAIFDRFHQVDRADAREKGGTGLGLPIARAIAEQHGGQLWAENAVDGPGAVFRLALPVAAEGAP
jgi:PAS domain S-box-containing protein